MIKFSMNISISKTHSYLSHSGSEYQRGKKGSLPPILSGNDCVFVKGKCKKIHLYGSLTAHTKRDRSND